MTASQTEPWTILRLISWTKDYLDKAGVDDPRLSAEVLLAYILGCRRIDLYTRFNHVPTQEELAKYKDLIQRAKQHEPVAYLVGEKEFYSLRFKVTPDVLIPRPETESLVTEAISHLHRIGQPGKAWDVCTGSGCVAVAIATQVKDATVLATDISPSAVAVARSNAELHGVQDRVLCRVADLLTLPEDCRDLGQFDVIAANPPYVAQGDEVAPTVRHEPALALYAGRTGLDLLEPIIRDAPGFLRPGGLLILEFGHSQADAVRNIIVSTGQFEEPRILRDQQQIERTATAVRKA